MADQGEFDLGLEIPEPSSATSEIILAVEPRRLISKLAEYDSRPRLEDRLPPDLIAVSQFEILREHLKPVILRYVLEFGLARDTELDPITMREIALLVQDETGYPVVRAVTFPFVQGPDEVYGPDLARLRREGSVHEQAFSDAYFVIQRYAAGDTKGVYGGTGLPE